MPYKVCFRGDGRHPTAVDAIFTNGFQKRTPGVPVTTRGGPNYAGDIDPVSAVCVSARISGAALFPLYLVEPPPTGPNYLYMMALETERIFNTHKWQVEVSLASPLLAGQPADVMWPLFAQELAVDDVPPGNIIAAISFTRTFFGDDWQAGGTYTLGTVILPNPNCNIPAEVAGPAMNFLQGEVANHRVNQPLPTRASGFHVSTGH